MQTGLARCGRVAVRNRGTGRLLFLMSLAVTGGMLAGLRTAPAAELPPAATRPIDFQKDVHPLLVAHCIRCHGGKKQESGLRLDRRVRALQGGDLGPSFEPGKSASSRLIAYVAGTDPDKLMPPDGEPLSAEQIGILRAWIDQGANWPDDPNDRDEAVQHWAYQPLSVAPPPAVQKRDWVRNPIDQFVLSELEKRSLTPSPEADRATLIRRLSLDLNGLLPTLEEVDAFVQDSRPDAYELLVDRLLSRPQFGERWGRHWLDLARYADSDGYEKDNPRPDAWLYRDWVIHAINSDLPFDQFTREQLAGDLLPNATPAQKLATAFHRQTLTNTEGGTDQEQFRTEACFDRTETTASVWMGLTMGCARCHSHKYEAITQREYYQLFSIFNNGDEQTTAIPKTQAEIDAYQVAKQAYDGKMSDLNARLKVAQAQLQPKLKAWEQQMQADLKASATDPLKLHPLEDLSYKADGEQQFEPQSDGSVLVAGANPERAVYTVTGRTAVKGVRAIRLDVLPDDRLPAKGPGRVAHGNYVLSELTIESSPDASFEKPQPVACSLARADFEQADKPWAAKGVLDQDATTGWAIAPHFGKPHWLIVTLAQPLNSEQPVFLRVRLSQQYGVQHTLGRFKLSLQTGIEPLVNLPEPIVKLLMTPEEQRNDAQKQQLLDHFSAQEPETKVLLKELADLKKQEPAKPEYVARVLFQRTSNPRTTYVLKRGEFLHPLTAQAVQAGGLAVLPPLKSRQENQPVDRLDLANWLVSDQHPLTPRVTVNHVWRLLFGQGLVRTPGDFGVRGDKPSHLELLDWLSRDFIGLPAQADSPVAAAAPVRWSRKALIKRIVMSATYRQSSAHRPELHEIDPQNVWLARQNRLRVEGEIVRDLSLDAAGLLRHQVGGPSVFPPLPSGIAELSYAGNFNWKNSTGNDRYRRGMYTFFKRTAPHPNLTTFDCPDANLTCLERKTSNTPLQALTILNNESFTEAAHGFARRLLQRPESDAQRLTAGFRICVARAPKDQEQQELLALLGSARDWYRAHPEQAAQLVAAGVPAEMNTSSTAAKLEPVELASWISTTRILLNLDEFLTRE